MKVIQARRTGKPMLQADLFLQTTLTGKQLRDDGIAKVLKPEAQWQEAALQLLQAYASGVDSFSVEDFREWALHRLYQQPHHLNAWGALVRVAALRRIIVKTGGYAQAKDPAAHARIIALWKKGD